MKDVVDFKESPAGEELRGFNQQREEEAEDKDALWAFPHKAQGNANGQQHKDIKDDVF